VNNIIDFPIKTNKLSNEDIYKLVEKADESIVIGLSSDNKVGLLINMKNIQNAINLLHNTIEALEKLY